MLKRLFKGRNRLDDPDPAVRREAVQALQPTELDARTDELARLVRDDPDTKVRLACIERMPRAEPLYAVLDDPELGDPAAARIVVLQPDFPPRPEEEHSRVFQARILNLATDRARAMLLALDDVDLLIRLTLRVRGELREILLAHPRLKQPASLSALERRSRDRDKALNRHARSALERYKQLQQQAQHARARAEELAAGLERSEATTNERVALERRHELHRRFTEALAGYDALHEPLQAFGEDLPSLAALRQRVGEPAAIPATIDAAPPADRGDDEAVAESPAVATAAPPGPAFAELVAGYQALAAALQRGDAFAPLAAERQRLTDAWLTRADHEPASAAEHQVFESVSHRYRELADAMARLEATQQPHSAPPSSSGSLPETLPDTPAGQQAFWTSLEHARERVRTLVERRRRVAWPSWARPNAAYAALLDDCRSAEQELARADGLLAQEVARAAALIDELANVIDQGAINDARPLLAEARARADALPAHAVRPLTRRLGRQAARLAELKDWQTFATAPKREALCEAIEALAAQPLTPREQAERIKALRRDWQALGPPAQGADARLAERFNAGAEKAFEPCRAYFAELAEVRQANLQARAAICEQLERYLADTDWSHTDMKAAERILRTARDEWRRFHPVDRQPGKGLEERFEALQGQLHQRIKAEWDANVRRKEALVAEAQALCGSAAPMPQQVTRVKDLQQRWREVGITPRGSDQRLWRAFRSACDGVFSAREHAREAADAERAQLAGSCLAELDAFEARLQDAADELPAEADLRRFVEQTRAIEQLPPESRRALGERRDALLRRVESLREQRAAAARRAELTRFKHWDEAMSRAEQAPPAAAEAATAAPHDWFAARAAAVARGEADGAPLSLDTLRRLTVKAELAAGIEPPAADEPLRLEVQVERLKAGLRGDRGGETAQALAEEWCRQGPKDASAEALRERFFSALERTLEPLPEPR